MIQAHGQEDHNEQSDCSSNSEKENQTMLSTSNKTKFQYQYLLIAVVILAIVSVIALYQSGVLPAIPVGQPATQNLTTLSAADASAYRWEAMARFYATQGAQIPVTGRDLTTLNAADASAYRWDAIARFYAGQASPAANLSWPARPDFSVLNERMDTPVFHYTSPGR
jgi:hypothetical protein